MCSGRSGLKFPFLCTPVVASRRFWADTLRLYGARRGTGDSFGKLCTARLELVCRAVRAQPPRHLLGKPRKERET